MAVPAKLIWLDPTESVYSGLHAHIFFCPAPECGWQTTEGNMENTIKGLCVVCGRERNIRFSLRVTRGENGRWQSNLVCDECRRTLISQARAENRFIPFFSVETSEREVAKRNEQLIMNRAFIDKFSRPCESPPSKSNVKPLRAAGKRRY